jgi:tetratricopeptide (TPR) repeat protein
MTGLTSVRNSPKTTLHATSPGLVRGGFLMMAAAVLGWLVAAPGTGLAQQAGAADLFSQAQVYEREQNYAMAEGVYRRLLASDPNNPEALKRLGIVEQTEFKFKESIEVFQHVLREHPNYPQVNFYLGLSYYGQRQFKDAITSFQQELKTGEPSPPTRYYLALAFEAEGRTNEAIDQLNQAALQNPDNESWRGCTWVLPSRRLTGLGNWTRIRSKSTPFWANCMARKGTMKRRPRNTRPRCGSSRTPWAFTTPWGLRIEGCIGMRLRRRNFFRRFANRRAIRVRTCRWGSLPWCNEISARRFHI